MAQETMNIALPDSMKEFVLQQVAAGGYSTASEYVRELIRTDQKRKSTERLETLLVAGLERGEPTPFTEQDWQTVRAKFNARTKKPGPNKSRGK